MKRNNKCGVYEKMHGHALREKNENIKINE